jgi:hypothetical protein
MIKYESRQLLQALAHQWRNQALRSYFFSAQGLVELVPPKHFALACRKEYGSVTGLWALLGEQPRRWQPLQPLAAA